MTDPVKEASEATEQRGEKKLEVGMEEVAVAASPWRRAMRKARNRR